jgi:hypothetical protein
VLHPPVESCSAAVFTENSITTTVAPTRTAQLAPPGLPNASNTGVPAGVVLTAYTGPSNPPAGTVIDGKLITTCLSITNPNVVVRNSRIDVPNCAFNTWITTPTEWTVLDDSEVICHGAGRSGIGERGFIVRRVEVVGCENGLDGDQDFIIEDSYIWGIDEGPNGEGHGDGIQSCCLINIVIRRNTIIAQSSTGVNGTSAIITPRDGARDTLIEGNFLAGGAYTLYCPKNDPINVRVINNTFADKSTPLGPAFGYHDGCASVAEFSGNVTDMGAPVTP